MVPNAGNGGADLGNLEGGSILDYNMEKIMILSLVLMITSLRMSLIILISVNKIYMLRFGLG